MSAGKPSQTAPQGAAQRRNISSAPNAINAFLRSRNDLTERQRTAVEFLLRGGSDQEVAAQVGVDRGTVLRWRKTIPFQRELDRQRRLLWEQSAGQLQSMVQPALNILQKQLTSDDVNLQIRAATVLLRFATPSRLAPAARGPESLERDEQKQQLDDLMAYVDAPLPGQPGAPEDMVEDDEE
jgi:hypothetical protein